MSARPIPTDLADRIHRAAHEVRIPSIYRRCIDRDLLAGDVAVLLETLKAAARTVRSAKSTTLAALTAELHATAGGQS